MHVEDAGRASNQTPTKHPALRPPLGLRERPNTRSLESNRPECAVGEDQNNIMGYILAKSRALVPNFDPGQVIHTVKAIALGSPARRSSVIQVLPGVVGGRHRATLFVHAQCMLRPRRHGACSRSRDRRVRASGPCRRRPRAASTSSTSLATADDRPAPSTVRSRAQ